MAVYDWLTWVDRVRLHWVKGLIIRVRNRIYSLKYMEE